MSELVRRPVGTTPDGVEVHALDLSHGPLAVTVLTYGARLQSVVVPDRDGRPGEVTLGYDDLAGYLGDRAFLGATVGRYANRIGGGRFTLDGTEHRLPQNHGTATLHGGADGFHTRVWDAEEAADGVALRLRSPDGDMGFPGAVDVAVTVTLDDDGLRLAYEATTDAPTVVTLTNHAYWNLAGPGTGTVDDHVLTVPAARYLPVDDAFVPLGDPVPVEGTVFDLRDGARLGDRVRHGDEQLRLAGGFDHCYVLDGADSGDDGADGLALAARVHDPASGRTLEVRTDEPGLQVYTGNQLPGTVAGRDGRVMRQGDGLCLETQHWPDSPNRPSYPSTVLRPGEVLRSTTLHTFGTTS
ncbi:aldose epimerase family protein [Aquipuribacter sp. SD81]|uniref:aldose epimerase family protein n=1 Tax=Aquipuribacter sp. SD81 TaxID=3127703 RepID=UPI0030190A59